ncbi:MAG: PP2C family protein-serine/threonine phosphatase [Acidobacteriota bacterium]|nr:serine/threonine-protein phosphatase [Blastocatellia bacterium]MDW8413206.1 PP2C family protein-serine/threonine phosphatase [Acidobacteriota bacterium]
MESKDRLLLAGFLLTAGLLLILGRTLIRDQAIVTWGLTFGSTTAVAVLLASLYRLQLELKASQFALAQKEAELHFALQVQQALFPKSLPEDSQLEISAVCLPARGISGDYYDVLRPSKDRLVFVVADVSGKGISAAILVSNVQAALRLLVEQGLAADAVCSRLNLHLYHVTDPSKYVTLFYAEWIESSRLLRYVNAGHYPPLLVGKSLQLEQGGPPLGLFAESIYSTGEIKLLPGDVLLLFSDGIIEATNSKEDFGIERLKTVVEQHKDRKTVEIKDAVLTAVTKWGKTEDDVTLLVVKVKE